MILNHGQCNGREPIGHTRACERPAVGHFGGNDTSLRDLDERPGGSWEACLDSEFGMEECYFHGHLYYGPPLVGDLAKLGVVYQPLVGVFCYNFLKRLIFVAATSGSSIFPQSTHPYDISRMS